MTIAGILEATEGSRGAALARSRPALEPDRRAYGDIAVDLVARSERPDAAFSCAGGDPRPSGMPAATLSEREHGPQVRALRERRSDPEAPPARLAFLPDLSRRDGGGARGQSNE